MGSYTRELSLTTYTPPQLGHTAVFYASAEGHNEVVKLLVQAGADVELQQKVYTDIQATKIHFPLYIIYANSCITLFMKAS